MSERIAYLVSQVDIDAADHNEAIFLDAERAEIYCRNLNVLNERASFDVQELPLNPSLDSLSEAFR